MLIIEIGDTFSEKGVKNYMKYQIDQSGKIEQMSRDSVIAYSNNSKAAILIPRKLKRRLQEVFRLHGFTSLFIYYLFSVGIYYLVEGLTAQADITVDTEYPGKDKIIKQFTTALLKNNNKPNHNIEFARIGNRPPAHYAAKDVFDKKTMANWILTMEQFIKALKKTDGRLRECLATLVDVQSRSYKKNSSIKRKKSQ